MQRIMLDIETLDTASTAVILSIGAVEFDDVNLGRRFHARVDIDSCLKHGLTISGSTISWWMSQPDEARKLFQSQGQPLDRVLIDFATWVDWRQVKEVWANGTDFDLPIIANAFRAIGAGQQPWPYYMARDYRTIRKIYSKQVLDEVTIEPVVEHDALEDAVAQARTLQALMASGMPVWGTK